MFDEIKELMDEFFKSGEELVKTLKNEKSDKRREIIKNHLKDYDIDWNDLNSLLHELNKLN